MIPLAIAVIAAGYPEHRGRCETNWFCASDRRRSTRRWPGSAQRASRTHRRRRRESMSRCRCSATAAPGRATPRPPSPPTSSLRHRGRPIATWVSPAATSTPSPPDLSSGSLRRPGRSIASPARSSRPGTATLTVLDRDEASAAGDDRQRLAALPPSFAGVGAAASARWPWRRYHWVESITRPPRPATPRASSTAQRPLIGSRGRPAADGAEPRARIVAAAAAAKADRTIMLTRSGPAPAKALAKAGLDAGRDRPLRGHRPSPPSSCGS